MDVMSINIHRMFEYLFCADESSSFLNLRFENDVKMYGTQTFTKRDVLDASLRMM